MGKSGLRFGFEILITAVSVFTSFNVSIYCHFRTIAPTDLDVISLRDPRSCN